MKGRRFVRTLLFPAALLLLTVPARALAAQLKAVDVAHGTYYIEVRLSFDKRPSYDESYRYDPDRYLLTLNATKSALSAKRLKDLGTVGDNLLTRISVYQGGGNLQLGFYLNQPVRPLISPGDGTLSLRFYNAVRAERVMQLAEGVSLTEKSSVYQGANVTLYIVRVDPQAAVALFSASADRYDGKTRLRTPASFARREGALAVINGGFFGKHGEHLTTLVEDGIMRASGVYPTRPMLVVTTAGQALIGRFGVVTALRFNGKTLPVNAKNYPFENGKVIVYDRAYPLESLPQEAMFYYLVRQGKLSYAGTNTKGLTLGAGELLLATDIMPEVNPLKQVPDGAAVELETRITDASGRTVQAASAIGGAPMLVENGAVEISVGEDKVRADVAKSERSRTAVGVTPSGQLILAVVKEEEDAAFSGMTLKALANLLIAEGAVTAMNLDGGGSSAMVVAGQVLNTAEGAQRPVANVLVVKEKPRAKPPS
jgi:exopolysaccharide biosynthesis protein